MNPQAVAWLEEMDPQDHLKVFQPVYPYDGELFSVKEDHVSRGCWCRESELVIE